MEEVVEVIEWMRERRRKKWEGGWGREMGCLLKQSRKFPNFSNKTGNLLYVV